MSQSSTSSTTSNSNTISIVQKIDNFADTHPNHIAIETPNGTVSYSELVKASKTLASQMNESKVVNTFVGIEAFREPAAIVAMIAAIRTRQPFLLIDPRDGTDINLQKFRLLGINKLVRQGVNLSDTEFLALPKEWTNGRVFAPSEHLNKYEEEIAYAIYTSGSSGNPKCVLVGYNGLDPVIEDHINRLDVQVQSKTLQFARLTFDGCFTEIFWTLCAGATLVLVNEQYLSPGSQLQETLECFAVTHLKTTPFALTETVPTDNMDLRHIINGGGTCRRTCVEKWATRAAFHNAYGCTETTICNLLTGGLTIKDCQNGIPLGQPVGKCQVSVIPEEDTSNDQISWRGELVISDQSVGIGYLYFDGVKEFREFNGQPFYRTGDLVENRNGEFYYVERLDRQIKVRGYRIDPGEVEEVICRYPGIDESVVVAEAYEGNNSDEAKDALICYFIGEVESRNIRIHLENYLPYYKVPSVFKRLMKMPYTKNGKVDRNALCLIRNNTPTSQEVLSVGEQVIYLVRQLTGTEDADAQDNFFEIGGDSASSLILLKKLKELGWASVGVKDVIRAETLSDLIVNIPTSEGKITCVA